MRTNHHTLRRTSAAAVVCALAALAFTGTGATTPAAAVTVSTSPITQVVVIYQENHTFDDALGAVCQTRISPCDGYTGPVTFADGNVAANIVQPDIVPPMAHLPYAQARAVANQWDTIGGCTSAPYPCVSHSDPANIPNLSALADQFAVSDATFASGGTASFGAHITLLAGTIDGFVGNNPVTSKTGARPRPGWGCASNKDAAWAPPGGGATSFEPSCIPDAAGVGPYRTSQVASVPTVLQGMETAGLTWHLYQGNKTTGPTTGSAWSVCTYFAWCASNRNTLMYNSATSDFTAAAAAGTLPNLSLMMPLQVTSQHNNASMAQGDNYIGTIVSAVESSPQWDSTAIFITYDDCGCFYDHVTPPAGLGLRNPMVIVSPWVKPVWTDSTTAVQPYSVLAFIQHTFALASLSPAVDDAYDYSGSFDFTQPPLAPVPMTRTPISARERARIAAMPPSHDLT